ncbi:hypothetical protein ACIOKD_39245 [Streptomyces sp. NPDC087844]|uniref:hypothetical protein n=1 Tax=Streptomyces sp. NPDC087844 TaxID=3365805 RepID=UPI003823F817
MRASVLGIHGIGQHKKTASALEESWLLAAQRSMTLAGGPNSLTSLSVAFYGNLFNPSDGRLGHTQEEVAPLSPSEEQFIEEVLDSGTLQGVDEDESSARELGLPAVPGKIGRLLVRIDRRFGRNAGKYLLYILRQVHRYLSDEDLSKAIRDVVADSMKSNTRFVLAHSLGSVIAYDMLQRGELFPAASIEENRQCIVTFGSPLSWPTVLRMLGHGTEILNTNGLWHNIYDSADAVTGGQGLQVDNVQNVRVRNGLKDPHAAVQYLRQPVMGSLLTSHAGL